MTERERVRQLLCPECPIRRVCARFPEQLDACAAADLIQKEEQGVPFPADAPPKGRDS